MRSLVTGGSGFVGANLVRRLLRDGHAVHLLLRPEHDPWRLRGITADLRISLVDLGDTAAVRAALLESRPDSVFHLAAFGAYPHQTGLPRMIETNIAATASLLDASLEAGTSAFIHAGSSSEYGPQDHPTSETDRPDPAGDYAITKLAATHLCRAAALRHNAHIVTLRLYSIYGPWEAPTRFIPTLLVHALDGRLPRLVAPNTARDFVFVDDAVDAFLRAAARPDLPRGAVFNICTGQQSTIASAVAHVRTLLPVPAEPLWHSMEPRSWDTGIWLGSPAAALNQLAWRATTPLPNGLAQTLAWLTRDPARLRFYRDRIPPT